MVSKLSVLNELRKALQGGISNSVPLCAECQKNVDDYKEKLLANIAKGGKK